MTARLTPGKRLVKALEAGLPDGWSFTDADRLTLARMAAAEDRRHTLIALFEAEAGKPVPSAHKTAALAAEVRQLEPTSRRSPRSCRRRSRTWRRSRAPSTFTPPMCAGTAPPRPLSGAVSAWLAIG